MNGNAPLTDGNDHAFPLAVSPPSSEIYSGLTKRELFAAIILSGAINEVVIADRALARTAVEQADCLIDALNGKT